MPISLKTLLRRAVNTLSGIVFATYVFPVHAVTEVGVSEHEILVGQSTALTGPLADLGSEMTRAEKIYFDAVNANGGIFGRRINLSTLDDGYDVQKTVANVKRLIEQDKVFALFNILGTGNNGAILPMISQANIPYFCPFTGGEAVRNPPNRLVFNVRASYLDETEKIAEYLVTINLKKIGVVYQNNSFGKDGMAGLERALDKRGLKIYASASVESDAKDAAKAADEMVSKSPEAIVLITAGKPTIEVIHAYDARRKGTPLYALSVMGTQSTINALGEDRIGLVVTSVVPFPWGMSSPVAREYQAAMSAAGVKDLSFLGLEGYINAKVFVEALRRAGRDLTREKLMTAAESMSDYDLGDYRVSFGKGIRQGSHFVDLAVIASNGKFAK